MNNYLKLLNFATKKDDGTTSNTPNQNKTNNNNTPTRKDQNAKLEPNKNSVKEGSTKKEDTPNAKEKMVDHKKINLANINSNVVGILDKFNKKTTTPKKKKNKKNKREGDDMEVVANDPGLKLFSNAHKKRKRNEGEVSEMQLVYLENKEKTFVDDFPPIIIQEKKSTRKEWHERNFVEFESPEEEYENLSQLLDENLEYKTIKENSSDDNQNEKNQKGRILLVFHTSDPNNKTPHYYCKALIPRIVTEEDEINEENLRKERAKMAAIDFNSDLSSVQNEYYLKASSFMENQKKFDGYVIPHEKIIDGCTIYL